MRKLIVEQTILDKAVYEELFELFRGKWNAKTREIALECWRHNRLRWAIAIELAGLTRRAVEILQKANSSWNAFLLSHGQYV